MSRKTRKEKIIADLRRKIQSSPPASSFQHPISPQKETVVQDSQKIFSLPTSHQNPSLYVYPVQLIRKDLTKTLLLCILAISLEIALFLILEKYLILPFRIKL